MLLISYGFIKHKPFGGIVGVNQERHDAVPELHSTDTLSQQSVYISYHNNIMGMPELTQK